MINENNKKKYILLKKRLFDNYYKRMNDMQKQAVYTVNGPLLVLAGAGSGKTTVLVNRIAHIIRYGNAYENEELPNELTDNDITEIEKAFSLEHDALGNFLERFASAPCPQWSVLAITFTNKAAGEMKERLANTLGEEGGADEIWAGTFHSICVRILRRFGRSIGYDPSFTIYDTDDTKKVIAAIMKRLNIDEKMIAPKYVMNRISRAKDKLIDSEAFAAEAKDDFRLAQTSRVYAEYERELKAANALDFDDIIMQTVKLFQNDPEALSYYQNRFKYVCVDEFQDTNLAQLKLCELISGRYRNIMVVGDDDQSIYKFRGATIENILSFDRDFTDCKVIKLEQNYRSTGNILDAANAVIANNKGRKGKMLWTSGERGEKIIVNQLPNQNYEAQYVADEILKGVKNDGAHFSDYAVLYRMNSQSAPLESVFAKSGIPYRLLGGLRFFERKEIKDIIAYLCVVQNPSDNLRLRRIINEPKRKIGEATLNAVEAIAVLENTTMFSVMKNANDYVQLVRFADRLTAFAELIDKFVRLSGEVRLDELINTVIEDSGYHDMLINEGETGVDRLHNLDELISSAAEYATAAEVPTLSGYLEEVALVSDTDNYDATADAVVLMTIHSAKGLEFDNVFLPGFEEGIFPGLLAADYEEELEEERRLAYVAITRAKKRLYILNVRERLMFGKTRFNRPSRFLDEVPAEFIEDVSEERKPFERMPRTRVKPPLSPELTTPVKEVTSLRREKVEEFAVGTRVNHAVFGDGTILSAQKMGSDLLYEIIFDKVGTKKLMANFARLKRC